MLELGMVDMWILLPKAIYIMASVMVMIPLVMHAEKNHRIYNLELPG